MGELLLMASVALSGVSLVLLLAIWLRKPDAGSVAAAAALAALGQSQERIGRTLVEEIRSGRREAADAAAQQRQELGATAHQSREEITASLESLAKQLADSTQRNEERLEAIHRQNAADAREAREELSKLLTSSVAKSEELRAAVEQKLLALQEDNARRLDQMRQTVDEKLHGTLEKRLGESFRQVSERLEQVHQGLGEMQTLASGVGDLKKVMTNVRARGTWGEIQLGRLLEDIFAPDQYARNVATRPGSGERVEFALKLPGRDPHGGACVWLPIDAKFHREDYQRLVEAAESGDASAAEASARALEANLKASARDIASKYLEPPHTTDFAILFLPTEGLYAEVIRRPGLVETLQRRHRVVVAGPTTLAALLNSLQMGFQTLAVQQRSSEVWEVLGAVKTEFAKFGGVMGKVHKKLQEASHVVDQAQVRTRAMERKLRQVEELPTSAAQRLLGVAEEDEDLHRAIPLPPPAHSGEDDR